MNEKNKTYRQLTLDDRQVIERYLYEGKSFARIAADLEVSTHLELAAEPDNPHDNSAVSVSYQGKKLGYIPQAHNSILSKLLFFGHGDALGAQINRITPDVAPERQIGIVVRIKDAR